MGDRSLQAQSRTSSPLLTTALLALLALASCEEPKKPAEPPVTKVSRETVVVQARPNCGRELKFWRGPDGGATVHLVLTSSLHCKATLLYVDTKTSTKTPAAEVPEAKARVLDLKVPGDMALECQCAKADVEDEGCECRITGVDPVVPGGAKPGAVVPLPITHFVTDPPPGTAPPPGTPVVLSCGKKCTLWNGSSAFVTVRFSGGVDCKATITTDGGATESTDETDWSRTLGPLKRLDASCDGVAGNLETSCELEVSEVVQLP